MYSKYRYDSTGERTNKRSESGGETLYFNSMWLATEDSYDFRRSKNIYLGETRIATRLNMESDPSTGYEAVNTYYYHPDHLGSSNIVTTPDGEVFEHIEYTPYGETWIEKSDDLFDMLPYKFTAKELDTETGLYYYGARYLNPRTSQWINADPAGFDLINPMKNGKQRENYSIFEAVNWYSYVSNNPARYIDPTGMVNWDTVGSGLLKGIGGLIKMFGGAGIVVGSGGAEVLSGGAATPLAVAGIVFGGTFSIDGFVSAVTGAAQTIDGLLEDSGNPKDVEIPDSMSEMLGTAGDAFIEASTGKESDLLENVGKWVGGQPFDTVDGLLTPTPIGDGELPDDFDLDSSQFSE